MTRKMKVRSTGRSRGLSKNVKLPNKSKQSLLGMSLSPLLRVLLLSIFFVAPSGTHIPNTSLLKDFPRAQERNGGSDPVFPVDHLATGEVSAPSTHNKRRQEAPVPRQNLTDSVKDKYSLPVSDCNQVIDVTLTDDYYEYEQGEAEIIVKGRLKSHVSFWIQIGSYDNILDVIRNGYKIPFFTTPPPAFLSNNKSSLMHDGFVRDAIRDLLNKGLTVECSIRPHVVNPLTVSVQSNGKKRLILDLRHVNKHLWKSTINDASGTGYGGYIVENPLSVSHGMWSESEKVKSSTWRELVAVERVLSSTLPFLNNKRIKWFSDNTNVVSIIEKGSMKQDLQQIALRIFNMCLTNNISLYTEWVPRTENEKADQISRIIDHDDWGVSMSIFQYLDALWGPHEIDFFASCTNNKLPVFYSRYWMPGATGIDAFTVDWHGVNGWFVPPVCIISRVLGYMRQCCAFGTVILPCWQSASFWPLIADDTGFISAVIAHVELPVKKDFYHAGKTGSLFGRAFKDDLTELPDSLADKFVFVADLVSECKSTNTVKNYYSAFKKWKSWAIRNGIPESECLPAKPIHVALYLASVVQQSQSPGPVTQAFYGIRWSHSIISAPSPTESDLVKNVLEGAKRRLSHHVKKKEPITPQLLEKMFDNLFIIGNLYNQRTICACLLSYAGFLRVSELLHLKICDVCFFESHMAIFIEKSKTDVYRDGNWLVISKTGTKLCPVINLQRYFEYGNFQNISNDMFLFRNLTKCCFGYIFRSNNIPMSYTRMREIFISAFSPFVSNIKDYGLHSLRSGGATAAASFGIHDRLFKRHGRWKSELAKDGYVKDSLHERLLVTKCLGI
ncbi:hypothetical protein FSP39_012245 [Pinctada imbricata]|uniref:Tyr recombinase domain-containing protein n=1 Tax=Pinctada imbricata TaxID=66713 RepID=A0AA88YEF7_PINIB|nr:hypothetical protein FSP39_012245 [Pinctada imbricata]